MAQPPSLHVQGVSAGYGNLQAVHAVDLELRPGSVTALVGPNGAGKSTLLTALVGGHRGAKGTVSLGGRPLTGLSPTDRAKAGLVLVPQGRQIFPTLTVAENLQVMADALSLPGPRATEAAARFPILATRRDVPAGSLSGGEQQMLALARALMAKPKVLLLDEPTLGLAPVIVAEIVTTIRDLAAEGMTILIAEPSIRLVRGEVSHGYVMLRGQIVERAEGAEALERAYLHHMGFQGRAAS